MIEVARSRFYEVTFSVGDMRDFRFENKFNLIFIALNSLQHLQTRVDLEQLFNCVKKHLAPGGEFAFSIFNPSLKILTRDPKMRFPIGKFYDDGAREEVTVEETTVYDPMTQIMSATWYYSTSKKPDFFSHPLSLRNIFPQELDELLHYNKFEIIQKYGDYEGSKFIGGSVHQVVRSRVVR